MRNLRLAPILIAFLDTFDISRLMASEYRTNSFTQRFATPSLLENARRRLARVDSSIVHPRPLIGSAF
jgi:hypothetical protein